MPHDRCTFVYVKSIPHSKDQNRHENNDLSVRVLLPLVWKYQNFATRYLLEDELKHLGNVEYTQKYDLTFLTLQSL
jgi:hypothetical protein